MSARISADQLRSIVERIERLEEAKADIANDIKEVYAEAKANGYDTKTVRSVVRLRKQSANERAEQEALLHTYMGALGMLPLFEPNREAIEADGYGENVTVVDRVDEDGNRIRVSVSPEIAEILSRNPDADSEPASGFLTSAEDGRGRQPPPTPAPGRSNPEIVNTEKEGTSTGSVSAAAPVDANSGARVSESAPGFSPDDLEIPGFLKRTPKENSVPA